MKLGPTRRTCLRAALSMATVAGLPVVALPVAAGEFMPWSPMETLPPIEMIDMSGAHWTHANLRGRAVMLNFWASWCEPCRAEMPTLQQLAEFYGDKQLVVLAVNYKESRMTAAGFAKRSGMTLPIVLDSQAKLAAQCAIRTFPTTIGLDVQGKPKWRARGEFDWSTAQAGQQVESLFK